MNNQQNNAAMLSPAEFHSGFIAEYMKMER